MSVFLCLLFVRVVFVCVCALLPRHKTPPQHTPPAFPISLMCTWSHSALFVTWNKHGGSAGGGGGDGPPRLRGCIGTLEPRRLHVALRDYALTR